MLGFAFHHAKYPAHETESISTHSGQIASAYLRSQVLNRSISDWLKLLPYSGIGQERACGDSAGSAVWLCPHCGWTRR